jgi:hypothetical protein
MTMDELDSPEIRGEVEKWPGTTSVQHGPLARSVDVLGPRNRQEASRVDNLQGRVQIISGKDHAINTEETR